MKKGDLVIGEKSWGYIEELYIKSCKINAAGLGIGISEWLSNVKPAKMIEVNSGVFLTEDELAIIVSSISEERKLDRLEEFADKYIGKKPSRLLGYGLLETREIIYTQIVEDEKEKIESGVRLEMLSSGLYQVYCNDIPCGRVWYSVGDDCSLGGWRVLLARSDGNNGEVVPKFFQIKEDAVDYAVGYWKKINE